MPLDRGKLALEGLNKLVAGHKFTGAWPTIDRFQPFAGQLVAAMIAPRRVLVQRMVSEPVACHGREQLDQLLRRLEVELAHRGPHEEITKNGLAYVN